MDSIIFVAFADVAPVSDENAPVRSGDQFQSPKPFVSDVEQVGGVSGGVGRPLPDDVILVDSPAVEVQGEAGAPIGFGPIIPLIDHQSAMGVTSACHVGRSGHVLDPRRSSFRRYPSGHDRPFGGVVRRGEAEGLHHTSAGSGRRE
jgi:hypothetical protein